MYPERPNVNEYSRLMDRLADLKDDVAKLEYQLEKSIANNIRTALQRGAKTREVDCVKILGNSKQEERELDDLKQRIIETKKEINITQGRVYAWQASKDLYVTDSYHQVRGSIKKVAEIEDD
jgi:nucleoid DNA-binding protein